MPVLPPSALDQLFLQARTHNGWLDRPVPDAVLHELFDLVRMGPTSANSSPARFVFVKSAAAKERLRPAIYPGNVEKTMSAPVTVLIAYDLTFHERLPRLFPMGDKRAQFAAMPDDVRAGHALANAAVEAGYLILAARALGLDCGPIGGFDAARVEEAFFGDLPWKVLFLVNLGYGDPEKLYPRNPRLTFSEVARIE
ncbi:MAG TPA: malonic semialdehyde reductase [Sorangium sp.]|nr:malonic semialdehyde reductase [Sorangium sp.]